MKKPASSAFIRVPLSFLLLALIFAIPHPAAGQNNVYGEDFEDGRADGWDLQQGWQVAEDGENHALRGEGHVWAVFRGGDPASAGIETLEFLYKLPAGSAHVNYRLNSKGGRYFVRLEQASIALQKSTLKNPLPPEGEGDRYDHPVLIQQEASAGGDRWHTLRISGTGNQIQVVLDGQVSLDYTDPDSTYLSGGAAFEMLDDVPGSFILVDDLVLQGSPPAIEDQNGPGWVFTGGPRGGIGYDIRIDPLDDRVIWVTDAYAGAHQSLDAGQTWTAKNNGINARVGFSGDAIPIFSLTIDPNNPDVLWSGTQGMRGVYKSVDGGESWKEMDNGIQIQPNMETRGFTVDPTDSNTVYCSGNYLVDPEKNIQRGFIYKTTDGGENWQLIAEPGALVRWIIVDPADHNIVYAATGIFDRFAVEPEGILKSYDGGLTWERFNNGLTSLAVGALAMDPANPLTLLAGTGKAGFFMQQPGEIYGGIFKTTDGGQTWRQVDPIRSTNIEIRFSAIAYAPSNPKIVYADTGSLFLRSEDGGENWQTFDVGPEAGASSGENRGQPIALVVHPQDPNWIYMNAYDGGVFISRDGGRTWQDASRGYSGAQAWSIAVHPTDPATAAVASKNGIHITRDGGLSWQGLITDGHLNNLTAVAFDPGTSSTLLLGSEIDGSIWKTADGGERWLRVLGPLGEDVPNGRRAIYRIAFAPSNPQIVYTATGIDTMTVHIPEDTIGTGVYKSLDGGSTWEEANGGLEGARFNALDLAIHPQDENIVYLGTLTGGVYKTVDGGLSWSAANQGLPAAEIRSVAVDPHNPQVVFAGTGGAGVWKSADAGVSWTQASTGLPPEAAIFSLVFDPAQPGAIYAADRFSGVYVSRDAGNTWLKINRGLQVRAVNELAISGDGQHVYAATEGNGVYRLDLNGAAPEPPARPSPQPELTAPASPQSSNPTAGPDPLPNPAAETSGVVPGLGWPIAVGVVCLIGMLVFFWNRSKR